MDFVDRKKVEWEKTLQQIVKEPESVLTCYDAFTLLCVSRTTVESDGTSDYLATVNQQHPPAHGEG